MFKVFLLATVASAAVAQTKIDLPSQSRRVDFSAATSTRPVKTGTSLPATCAAGEMFFKTDSPAGSNLYACVSADHWMQQSGSGSMTIESEGAVVGTSGVTNFNAGPGISQVFTQTPSGISITSALNTAMVQTQGGEQRGTALLCASVGGSGASYSCTLDPAITRYTAGMLLHWVPDVDASPGPIALEVDSLGPAVVKAADGVTDPAAGTVKAGRMCLIWHDGTKFRIVREDTSWSELRSVPSAFPPSAHAASHQNGGADEMSSATPSPNGIPKAGVGGTLAAGWLPAGVRTRAFGYSFDGAGGALLAGKTGYLTVPFACTISAWNLVVNTGTATVDIWKAAAGAGAPTVANSVTASATPSIASGTAVRGTSLSGWTTAVAANDVVAVQLKTVSGASFVNLTVECNQ